MPKSRHRHPFRRSGVNHIRFAGIPSDESMAFVKSLSVDFTGMSVHAKVIKLPKDEASAAVFAASYENGSLSELAQVEPAAANLTLVDNFGRVSKTVV